VAGYIEAASCDHQKLIGVDKMATHIVRIRSERRLAMKLRSLGALLVIAGLSAGCSAVRVIDHEGGQNYYGGAFEFATLDGTIKTHVVGSPFGKSAPPVAQSVTANMKGATRGRAVTFIPSPRNTTKHAFHVVVVFNGKNPLIETEVCQNADEITTVPSADTTVMFAVFCQDGHPLSYSTGFVDGLESPADPRFPQLVKQVARAMVPGYDDYRSSGFTPF
jgi:hypothetical protein